MSDEFSGQGGRYTVNKAGKRVREDKPQEMPEGGGARDSKGNLLNADEVPNTAAFPEPATVAPWAAPAAAEAPADSKPAAADKKRGE